MPDSHYAFAVPILPGKLGAWKKMVDEVKGPRRKAYQASRKKAGIKHEHTWLQHMPQGDFVVVSVVGRAPSKMLERFAASRMPFDRWFLAQIADIHGIQRGTKLPTNKSYMDEL